MVTIRTERFSDVAGRETLLDAAYGPARFTKTSERLREGRLPAEQLAFVAVHQGRLVGTVRLWHVWAGPERPALLLGPLAVHPEFRNRGIGSMLVRHAISAAHRLGHGALLLVGDASYYARFGFAADLTAGLWMPGRYERDRLLARELRPGALASARGPDRRRWCLGAQARPERAGCRRQGQSSPCHAAGRLIVRLAELRLE